MRCECVFGEKRFNDNDNVDSDRLAYAYDFDIIAAKNQQNETFRVRMLED